MYRYTVSYIYERNGTLQSPCQMVEFDSTRHWSFDVLDFRCVWFLTFQSINYSWIYLYHSLHVNVRRKGSLLLSKPWWYFVLHSYKGNPPAYAFDWYMLLCRRAFLLRMVLIVDDRGCNGWVWVRLLLTVFTLVEYGCGGWWQHFPWLSMDATIDGSISGWAWVWQLMTAVVVVEYVWQLMIQ